MTGGLDLRSFPPLVVARDRHEIRSRVRRRPPHRVVRRAEQARLHADVPRRLPGRVTRPDGRRAEDPFRAGLRTEPSELRAVVEEDVVGIETGETASRGEADVV